MTVAADLGDGHVARLLAPPGEQARLLAVRAIALRLTALRCGRETST